MDGETCLTSGNRRGQTLFDYRTGDRCIIDLVFMHRGVGRAGLVFGHAGRRCRLRLPFHVPEQPHLRFNRLEGVRGCPRGTYGVEPERLHRALADEVAALAAETGARLCPITACGNAWGAMRAASVGGGACPAEILRTGADVVLAVGCDLLSAYGATIGSSLLDGAEEAVYVGPMANRTAQRASLLIPAAFTFETAGRALLGPDRLVEFEPLMRPPAGVPTVAEILDMAGASGEEPADVSAPCQVPAMPEAVGAGGGDRKGIVVAPASDAVHFDDGSVTGRAAWPQAVRPRPVLALAASDAEAAGLSEGHTAVLEGPGGSAEVNVVVRPGQRAGQGWVSRGFAEVRDAFGWSWDGSRPGEPVCMEVRKA